MTRYTAMAGLSGCMPNFCEDADSYEDAVEMLVSLHELGKNRARLLKRDGYLVLNLHRDGNEYCEVVQAEEGKEMKVRTPEIIETRIMRVASRCEICGEKCHTVDGLTDEERGVVPECEHSFVPVNNDGKTACRFCGEMEVE